MENILQNKLEKSQMEAPGDSDSKKSDCNARDQGSTPGSGRSPGEVNSYPLQYSGFENSMDKGAWPAACPWGHKELDMTE